MDRQDAAAKQTEASSFVRKTHPYLTPLSDEVQAELTRAGRGSLRAVGVRRLALVRHKPGSCKRKDSQIAPLRNKTAGHRKHDHNGSKRKTAFCRPFPSPSSVNR